MIRSYEFWHPRIFEVPYYLYLGLQCLRHRVAIKQLAKANYRLDHGEIGLGSKYQTQMAFDQGAFLPTVLIKNNWRALEKRDVIERFVEEQAYPVIFKPDIGCVGKGIRKVSTAAELEATLPLLLGDYILQKFTPFTYECGVFFTRHQGREKITGINRKHFPTVTGNGRDSLLTLAKNHPRYSHHWQSFLRYLDTDSIIKSGQKKVLSFIGSHTLGCRFTDDRQLLTPALEKAIFKTCQSQAGYNFGRLDIKAENEAACKAGKFVIIEANGIASLPTHMFDPKYTLIDAYKIFFEHASYLVKIAKEHRHQKMDLLPYSEIIKRTMENQARLNQVHTRLKDA
ncbi:MAG: hypothetical protein KTR20_13005 [Cellvibrionaceae bacterium]|nr:hypothetical protein [Cellvibrionaceae bacterium]